LENSSTSRITWVSIAFGAAGSSFQNIGSIPSS
jgi:hypothetical protein